MVEIPEEYRRITEERIDELLRRQLSTPNGITGWFLTKAFPGAHLLSVEHVSLHRHEDHRAASGDPLAFGETDVEVIARAALPDRGNVRVGLLIEDKVDARQADAQGLRYQARGRRRQRTGSWDEFRCLLVAPQFYLDSAYPLKDFTDHGWDALVSFEDIASALKRERPASTDIAMLEEAASRANAWNKPEPSAAQFWKDLALYQRAFHPDVPIFAAPQQGAQINVWPSFYENQLRGNNREIRRRTVQLVHSGGSHVSLFIKNVRFEDFEAVAAGLLEPDMRIGARGKSWQSVQLPVPAIDPVLGVERQTGQLDLVFGAARRLYELFLKHEAALLGIPKFK